MRSVVFKDGCYKGMAPRCYLAWLLFICLLSLRTFAGEKSPDQQAWKLVWHDEFKGKELSSKKWNVLTREQSKHNELQYYLPDEVYLQNGCLRLRSRVRDFG